MADIQKQVQDRIKQIDTQYDGTVADRQAAAVIMDAIKYNDPSRLKNYRGDLFHRNNAEAQTLLKHMYSVIEGELGNEIRNARNNILHESQRETKKVKLSYQQSREEEANIGRSRGTTAESARGSLKEYQVAIAASKEFEDFNAALSDALSDALDGQFIEGGAVGLLKSIWNKLTGRNLQKKLNALKTKFPRVPGIQNFETNYYNAIAQHKTALDALLAINGKNAPYANADILSRFLGYKDRNRAIEIFEKPKATFLESKNRAIADIVISALGSIGGGFDIVLGHIKVPFFTKAYHVLPDKDIVGQHFFGGKKGTSTLEAEMRAGDKAVGKLADYLKRGVSNKADMDIAREIAATRAQLEERIDWSDDRVEDSLAKAKRLLFGGRLGSFFGQIFDSNLRTIASNINKVDSKSITLGQKAIALEKAIIGLETEQNLEVAKGKNRTIGDMVQIAEAIDSARFLLSRVRNSMSLGGQKEAVESQNPNVRKLEGILSQFPSYAAFRASNIIHPDAAPFFEKYYTQGVYNGRLVNADFLYNSALTPGVQEFTRVRGSTSEYARYADKMAEVEATRERQTRGVNTKNFTRKNKAYWTPDRKIETNSDLQQAFLETTINGQSLSALYTRQIARLTGFTVTPNELYNGLASASPASDSLFGNSAFSSVEPGSQKVISGAKTIRIPKSMTYRTPDGLVNRRGDIIIGIKPGCTNLLIAKETFDGIEWEDTRYAGQAAPESYRFIVTWSMFDQGGKKVSKKIKKKDKPNTPDTPGHPPHKPPHNPPRPNANPSTTPQSGTVPNTVPGTGVPGSASTGTATLPAAPSGTSATNLPIPTNAVPPSPPPPLPQ